MKKGRVRISKQLVQDALGFPVDWNIEEMTLDHQSDIFEAVISGSDFPEAVDEPKECVIVCHKEAIRFEVKER